jgi:plasmid stability protein
MANVLIRHIPDDIHASLRRRAEQGGQSLQQYLANERKRPAERPGMDEVLARSERHRGGRVGLLQAADDIAEERARR